MDIWHYDPEDGRLLAKGAADPDPMTADAWIVPAWATTIAAPVAPAGQAAVFTGSAWRLAADHRGETWWAGDGTPVVVNFLGDPGARGLLNTAPPAPAVQVNPEDRI